MDIYSATSDVKCDGGGMQSPPNVGFTSNVLPEANTSKVESSQTGVSTSSVCLSLEKVDSQSQKLCGDTIVRNETGIMMK